MANLTDFTSVLEISFAINALVYFFDVLPKQRNKDSLEIDEFDRITQELKDSGCEGLESEYFKDGLVKYNSILSKVLSVVVIFNSVLSLALLIWVGFAQDLCLPWYVLVLIIFILFVPVTVLYLIAVKYRKCFTLFVLEKLSKQDGK